MKKVILSLVALVVCVTFSFAQLKVETAGVGIGDDTQTPAEKLEVFGGLKIGTTSNTNAGTMRFNLGDFEGHDGTEWKSLTSGGSAVWSLNGGEAFFNDNVGIGTNNPERSLHVSSSSGIVRIDRFSNTSGPAFLLVNQDANKQVLKTFAFANAGSSNPYFYIGDVGTAVGGSNTRRFVINGTTGYVTIGSETSPVERLHVQGRAYKTSGGSAWSFPSDRRLKRNIEPFDKGLDVLMRINPVKYFYNGLAGTDANEEQVGIIAQELQKVLPNMVKTFKFVEQKDAGIDNLDGDSNAVERSKGETKEYLTVNDSNIKYILVNSIKEQQKIIQQLEKRIKALENK